WKDRIVEHYDLYAAYSAKLKTQAQELGRRCRILEARGEIPNPQNAIWTWVD
ncbi:unnamed protein product, partial [marine sediment metagenome]